MSFQLFFAFLASLITALIMTPLVIKFAIKIGAIDKPNERKVHAKVMPRLGGLAIFISTAVGFFVSGLYEEQLTGVIVGALVIVILGVLDDKFELSAKIKLLGQVLAGSLVIASGLSIDLITIPFVDTFELGAWTYPVTLFWILAITNAINLIDGLDGLSAGVSSIVISTIAVMAGLAGKEMILSLALVLLGSTIGFLYFNFNPAKIFMGDTGSMFLGYSISILSLLGLYKSVTLFSFVVPIIILGVPVFDTTYAIIRRVANKKPISAPDKSHLHHRLLALGLSHRNTVLVIYGLGILFSVSAIIFSAATLWGSVAIIVGLLLATEVVAETVGLVNDRYKPIIKIYRKVFGRQ